MKLPHVAFSYGRRLHPERDWSILLAVAGICLLASVGWNLWLFNLVSSGEVLGSHPKPVASTFDQSELDRLTKIFTGRASELTKYQDGTHTFIDPSK